MARLAVLICRRSVRVSGVSSENGDRQFLGGQAGAQLAVTGRPNTKLGRRESLTQPNRMTVSPDTAPERPPLTSMLTLYLAPADTRNGGRSLRQPPAASPSAIGPKLPLLDASEARPPHASGGDRPLPNREPKRTAECQVGPKSGLPLYGTKRPVQYLGAYTPLTDRVQGKRHGIRG